MAHFLVAATSVLLSPFAPKVTIVLVIAYVVESILRR